ncbi:hypothetical protein LOTGIDRAFT_238694 [Lottia gigantea]|uniref:Apple domain-containing protein n=1 Tax=Lottia gigantea TaxID=225164 RepID=V4ARJ8_LOTGI|nr:hypothetical protein LOTGIDRAFT_238694 [Lottia gigantea]ESO99842.1 hypothetical protein LOTGIDRAFT_238694 [Lottia gigantea]
MWKLYHQWFSILNIDDDSKTVSDTVDDERLVVVYCNEYDLPEKAEWIPRASCEENKRFACKSGYQLQIQTSCKENGKWYLEPSCQDCYKYSNVTYLVPDPIDTIPASDQEECDELCKNNTQCTYSGRSRDTRCFLFSTPVIFVSSSTDLDQCIKKCTETNECVTMSSKGTREKLCFLFNVSLNKIPDKFKNGIGYTIAEKVC